MASVKKGSSLNSFRLLVLVVVFGLINVISAGKPTSAPCSTLLGDETNQVFRGVDITDFDIMPLNTNTTAAGDSRNLKGAIFENTKTCVYSENHHTKRSLIIERGTDASSSLSVTTIRNNDQAVYWQAKMIGDSNLKHSYNSMVLSHCPSVKTVRTFLKTGNKVFIDALSSTHEFKVIKTKENLRQSANFKNWVRELIHNRYKPEPDGYMDDSERAKKALEKKTYNDFIASYGTHYIEEAYFGAVDRISVVMDREYHDQQSASTITKSFWKAFSGADQSDIFEPAAKAEVYQTSYGNNGTAFIYRMKLKPIYDLLDRYNHMASSVMRQAVRTYINSRYTERSN